MRIFRVYIPGRIVLLVLSEALLVFACFPLAGLILGYDLWLYMELERGYEQFSTATASLLVGFYFRNLYSRVTVRRTVALIQDVLQTAGVALIFQALLTYVYPSIAVPQRTMVISTALVCVVVPLWRTLYGDLVFRAVRSERLLFLGTSETSLAVANRLAERPEFGIVCGFVDDPLEGQEPRVEVIGTIAQLREVIRNVRPDRVVVGMRERRSKLPVNDLLHLRFSGLPIEEAAMAYERVMGRVAIRELNPSHLIYSTELGPNPRVLALQMCYSILLAVIGLVLALPIMIGVALLVKATSRGPVLFRQERVGLYGRTFTLYKFRSMVVDAEARTGAVWAKKNDSRVTPVGRWLRKLRLDELPQLWNVLCGHMALVGPRPERPEFVRTLSEQIPFYPQRHYVRPGVTGWAQINYKYGDTIEDTFVKLEYDLYYLKNVSPALDFFCMLHTVRVMLLAEAGQ